MDFQMVSLGNGESLDLQNNLIMLRDPSGQLVKLDIGPADVHINAALSNYIGGYHNADFCADSVAPPLVVDKASNYFYTYSPDNSLQLVENTDVAPGADPPVVTPSVSRTLYQTTPRALAGLLPTELIANQDAALNIQQATARQVMDQLLLLREYRVMTLATTAANYDSSLAITLTAAQKWNGGASSDPVANIQAIMEASLSPVTHMAMSLKTWNAFTTNPAVQKYVAFKTNAAPLPKTTDANAMESWAALLGLPIPVICQAKYKTSSGYSFVWGGDVVLYRSMPNVSPIDVCTFKTFRWNGAGGPTLPTEFGGSVNGGFTVRSFYNPFKGARGSQMVIVAHNDAEKVTGGATVSLVGGVIKGAYA